MRPRPSEPKEASCTEKLSRFTLCGECRAGRDNAADPLSRQPNVAAHMVLCALDKGVTEELMADSDMVADMLAGYATVSN